MKYLKSLLVVLVLIASAACADNDETVPPFEPYVGNWAIVEVSKDGSQQPAWTGTTLVMIQRHVQGGTYQMPDTPYDSIWSSSGFWIKEDWASEFVLDERITTHYRIENDTLHVTKYLPWTRIPCDPAVQACLGLETGKWTFTFVSKD